MKNLTRNLGSLFLLAFCASGCRGLNPGGHPSYEDWYVGDPESEYDDYGMEDEGQFVKATYGLVLGIPYAFRDLTRTVMAIGVAPYYAIKDEPVKTPASSVAARTSWGPADLPVD